jgi:two-component system chemotaxis response regulator CheY
MSNDEKPTDQKPVEDKPAIDPNLETVIVAEDSDPNRQILCLLLRKLGFAVLEFKDGALAWDALQANDGRKIVAVVSDLMMPNMDGLELLRRVRNDEKWATLPFVLVTAVSDKDYVFEAKNLKVDGYILKPVTYKRVSDKMQALFPGRKFPQIAS